jgi:hypothetical protein
MSVLIIGKPEKIKIAKLVAHAAAYPVRWETMKDVAIAGGRAELKLADRKPGAERPPSEHVPVGKVRVAYSHEEQPAGMFRHLSASVARPGKLPHHRAVAMICEAFGFSKLMCEMIAGLDGPPPAEKPAGMVWLEEFDPGHQAVNVLELIEERKLH